jgi:SSS family solute:Na+ symporter
MFALTSLDISIIAASLAATVFVGWWTGRKKADSAQGYFLASGKMPWWIIGSAFVSTSVSSEQIVGTVSMAYQHGMGIANWEWFTLPMYAPLILFFIPVYLKNRVTTVPDFLRRRYGPLCADIYSWVMFLAYPTVFLVPVVYGGSLVISELTGLSFYTVAWGMTVLVGLYTVKGGLASVMWTDALQGAMLVGGGVLLFFIALSDIPGGWSAMMQADPDRFHLYRPADDAQAPFIGLIMGAAGLFLFYQASNQVMTQRVLAARSTWDGLMGIIFAGFINFLRPLVTCFLGFIVYHQIHHLEEAKPLTNPDTAFSWELARIGSAYGLRGVILAGFLAAVMSTISALANSAATIFSLDVYRRFIHRDADDGQMVNAGRWASLASLIVAALLSPLVKELGGIFAYFQTGLTYLATPFISVMLVGIFWKRANYAGGLFGVIGGIVIQAALALGAPYLGLNIHRFYLAFIAEVATIAGIVVISLVTAPPDPAASKPFQWSPELLSRYEDAGCWYKNWKLWFAVYAGIWAFLYWKYW